MTTRRPWYGSAAITPSAVYSCNNSIMHSSCGCTYVRILSLVFCFFILPWPHTVCCIMNSCTPLPPLIYPHILHLLCYSSILPPLLLSLCSLSSPAPPPPVFPCALCLIHLGAGLCHAHVCPPCHGAHCGQLKGNREAWPHRGELEGPVADMKVMGSLDQCMLGATVHACTVCTYIRMYVVCMYIINSFCGSTVGCVLSLCCCIHLCLSQSEMEVCSLTSQFEDFVLQLLDRYVHHCCGD